MTSTPNLSLPFIEGGQAQKHVTHNEALRALDALVMLTVKDRDLPAPPPAPADGDRYLVKAPGSGGFAGKDGQIAHFSDGGWLFHPPRAGWTCFVADESALLAFDGAGWVPALDALGGVSELHDLTRLGVGMAADAGTPFAARLNAALWTARTVADGGDGSLRCRLNKDSASHTLSLLMQTGLSGRAEIGLVADDDLHVRVSPDGAAWIDALLFDRASGATKINAGFFLTGDISPAQIAADQNDYNPAGLAAASILRLSSDAARSITGLSGGGDGRAVALLNAGTQSIVLKTEHGGSSAGNRFALGADVTLAARQSALLWYDAADSRWKLLAGPQAGGGGGGGATRELLTGNRTYYVRTDGSDSNDGLSNSAGGAFLTLQKAINVAAALDISIHDVTIQLGNGTYAGGAAVSGPWIGNGHVTVRGDTTTPSNVVISTTSAHCFSVTDGGRLRVEGVKMTTATAGFPLVARRNGVIVVTGPVDFGAAGPLHAHIYASFGGIVRIGNSTETGGAGVNYTISGDADYHFIADEGGHIQMEGGTVTASGTRSFSGAFANAWSLGHVRSHAMNYSGTFAGKRYEVKGNGVIAGAGGASATYFPGNANGTPATGGQYIS